jgi:hypothetical protein
MLSLPNHWAFSGKGLCKIIKNSGQTTIRSALKELKNAGYLEIRRIRDGGKFGGVEWILKENPTLPYVENPPTGIPNLGNQTQSNNKQTNIKKEKTIKDKCFPRTVESCLSITKPDFNFKILESQIRACYQKIETKPQISLESIIAIFILFIKIGREEMPGWTHPKIKNESIMRILSKIDYGDDSDVFDLTDDTLDKYENLIREYFLQSFDKNCNWSIVHFMSGIIRKNCYYKTMY